MNVFGSGAISGRIAISHIDKVTSIQRMAEVIGADIPDGVLDHTMDKGASVPVERRESRFQIHDFKWCRSLTSRGVLV